MVQQLGAALGLAVLVTLFGAVTSHAQLATAGESATNAVLVHGLDIVFGVGAGFALVALAIVALWVKPASPPAAAARPARSERTVDLDLAALEEALATEEAGEPALLAGAAPASTGPVSQIEI